MADQNYFIRSSKLGVFLLENLGGQILSFAWTYLRWALDVPTTRNCLGSTSSKFSMMQTVPNMCQIDQWADSTGEHRQHDHHFAKAG